MQFMFGCVPNQPGERLDEQKSQKDEITSEAGDPGSLRGWQFPPNVLNIAAAAGCRYGILSFAG